MAVTDRSKIALVSTDNVDKVLKTFVGTLDVTAGDGISGESNSISLSTGIPELCLFLGQFSTDGGVTWIDFGSGDFVNSEGLLPMSCYGATAPGEILIEAYTFETVPVTFSYKAVLIAFSDHEWAEYSHVPSKVSFATGGNYLKILLDDTHTVNQSADGRDTYTITHNLGYVPTVRSWIFDHSSNYLWDFSTLLGFDGWSWIEGTDTQIHYELSNENNPNPRTLDLYTRIYYDD